MGNDLLDLGIELYNVDFLSGVLGFHIGGNGEIIVIVRNFLIVHQMREVCFLGSLCKGIHDSFDVRQCQLVVVRYLDTLSGSINKQRFVVGLVFFQHHNTGRNGSSKEQIARQLNNTINKVVVDQVFSDFLLCAAAVHDAGETDDGRGAIRSEPGKAVHDEGHIRLALWRKDSGWGKARVIDEEWIAVPCPLDRVWWIRYDEFEGFIIPMLRTDQRIFTGDVEFIKADIMQEHIDAAEIVRRDIDFLPVEAIADRISSQHLFGFQKER